MKEKIECPFFVEGKGDMITCFSFAKVIHSCVMLFHSEEHRETYEHCYCASLESARTCPHYLANKEIKRRQENGKL